MNLIKIFQVLLLDFNNYLELGNKQSLCNLIKLVYRFLRYSTKCFFALIKNFSIDLLPSCSIQYFHT